MNPENDDSISKDRNQISEKYKEIFKTYKELTIREFVNKLRLETNDPSSIKSISQKEAVDLLLYIALSPIPFGQIFKDKIAKKLGDHPEKITFENILTIIEDLTLDQKSKTLSEEQEKQELLNPSLDEEQNILVLIERSKEMIDFQKIQDPFDTDEKVKEHTAMVIFLEESTISELELDLDEENLNRVISKLKLKTALNPYIEKFDIKSLIDFLRMNLTEGKSLVEILSDEIKSKPKLDSLKAFIRLDKVSKNLDLTSVLIEKGIRSYHDISKMQLYEFLIKFRNAAKKEELEQIYYASHQELARDVANASLRSFDEQKSALNYLVKKSNLPLELKKMEEE